MDLKFSKQCGDNVNIMDSDRSAAWVHRYSGGIIFSRYPVQTGEKVHIEITGNGHASIGFVQMDPACIGCLREAIEDNTIQLLTSIRTLKRAGALKVSVQDKTVCISCNGCELQETRKESLPVYIALYLKFGSVQAKMYTDDMNPLPFHAVGGENVDVEQSLMTKLKVENPASVVCLCRKLYPGEGITLKCVPQQEQGRVPSRFHFTLGISHLDATELVQRDPESFSVSRKLKKPKRWRRVRRFEDGVKEGRRTNTCTGYLQIMVGSKGDLKYAHSSDSHGHVTMATGQTQNGVLVVLELFRMTADIVKSFNMQIYDYVELSFGQFDSVVSSPKQTKQHSMVNTRKSGYVNFSPKCKEIVTKVPSNKT